MHLFTTGGMSEPRLFTQQQATNISLVGIVGLAKHVSVITDVSFDILSLEALFLLPRIWYLHSLVPFSGHW